MGPEDFNNGTLTVDLGDNCIGVFVPQEDIHNKAVAIEILEDVIDYVDDTKIIAPSRKEAIYNSLSAVRTLLKK